ncbi:MAG: hypothetical protein HUU21_31670 [Polyangiaceae bacterium]|nr:hypothetical protein [Polyangiaceae bacterium]
MKRRAFLGIITLSALGALLGLVAPGCLGDEATATEDLNCPNKSAFTGIPADGGAAMTGVSAYMERRCGTIDCHGSAYRWMRLHGQLGRRLPGGGNVSGGAPTTAAELEANYASVCGLEPEKTAEQVDTFGQSAEELLIVRKARGIEGHKGGPIVKEGDPGDQCIVGWLRSVPLAELAPLCQQAIDRID